MLKESEDCSRITETEFYIPIIMTKKIVKILNILLNVGFVKRNMKNK